MKWNQPKSNPSKQPTHHLYELHRIDEVRVRDYQPDEPLVLEFRSLLEFYANSPDPRRMQRCEPLVPVIRSFAIARDEIEQLAKRLMTWDQGPPVRM